jgi:hypothetical protein
MCNLATHNADTATFFVEDDDVDFSLTLPPWLNPEANLEDQWVDLNGPIAGPSNIC